MRQPTIIAIAAVTSVLGGTPSAQEHSGMSATDQVQSAPAPLPPPPTLDFTVGMLAVEPFEMGDPVENAPYSADIVNDFAQELPDGNRIERRTTGTVARDSHGRVRREHQLAAIGPVVPDVEAPVVTISDPVAHVHYALDPVRKIAMRSHPPRARTLLEGQAARDARVGAVMVNKGGGPAIALDVRGDPELPDVQTEQLGTKEIEGVRAE